MTDMAAVAPNPRVTGAMRYVRKGTRSAVAVPHRYAYHLVALRITLSRSPGLGVIWSLWQLPVVLDKPDLRVPAPFFLGVIPLAVLFTWLYLHTRGSLLIAVLFHAWYDLVLMYPLDVIARSDYARMWWLLFAVQSLVAVVVLLAERRRFTQKTTDPALMRPSVMASG